MNPAEGAPLSFVLAGLFVIAFLVVIHEFGHFVAAKIFGVGVPVFSVGMGPRLFGFELGGTDYRVSALPVGGYVQLAGADPFGEQDANAWVEPEQDFMRKPVWQRLIIMAAGPGVNLALPFVVFTVLLMLGQPDANSRVGVVLPGTPAQAAGLQVDDVIRAVDGEPVEVWHDVGQRLATHDGGAPVRLDVDRGGASVEVALPASAVARDAQGEIDLISLGIQPFYLSSRVGVEAADSPAGRGGLRTGDRVTAVDGAPVETWEGLLAALGAGPTHTLQVERRADEAAEPTQVSVTLSLDEGAYAAPHDVFANPWGIGPITLFASSVDPQAPAGRAGVQAGDRFLDVDGAPVLTFHHFIDRVARTAQGGTPPRPLELTVVRDGERVSMSMTPEVRVVAGEPYSRPIIGVSSFGAMGVAVDQVRKYYSLVEAVPRGFTSGVEVIGATAAVLGNIFTGRADPADNVGGPVAIFVAAGTVAERGFFDLAMFIGMLSVSLGVINLLPVPVLDGGQILFYLVEAVRGRPLSLELRERFQMVGVVGLVILMILVTANDVYRSIGL